MYDVENHHLGQIDLARAIHLNRSYARSLGWEPHYGQIAAALGFRGRAPGLREFVVAVARWQSRNRLRPIDGIIGPNTWHQLRSVIGLQSQVQRQTIPTHRASPTAQAIAPPGLDAFMERVLQAHIARSTHRRGAPIPDLRSEQLATVQGTEIKMRADAAQAASLMIAAANRDLLRSKQAGDPDALRTTRIGATSGYRSSSHQERLWREYFRNKYYGQTAADRSRFPGGPHGEEAVRFMVQFIGQRVAAPGFSNHQAGLAIDLKQHRTPGDEIWNSTTQAAVARWRNTWFFRWLQNNAGRFQFVPYEREPWHWVYRPR